MRISSSSTSPTLTTSRAPAPRHSGRAPFDLSRSASESGRIAIAIASPTWCAALTAEPPLLKSDAPARPRRGFAERLFGYDVFISFALGPPPRGAQSYASDLARRLRERDFSVFFSEDEAPPGEVLD